MASVDDDTILHLNITNRREEKVLKMEILAPFARRECQGHQLRSLALEIDDGYLLNRFFLPFDRRKSNGDDTENCSSTVIVLETPRTNGRPLTAHSQIEKRKKVKVMLLRIIFYDNTKSYSMSYVIIGTNMLNESYVEKEP